MPIESFFKTLKVERIYQNHYETRSHSRLDIVDWIGGYYNPQRLHPSIDYLTPVDHEARLIAACVAIRGSEVGSGRPAHRLGVLQQLAGRPG
ncbi:integrase core domain protein [Burkholderia pseudomallei]|nr:integrase core domain protein [Burkholderia pseudomallei]KGW66432.1 integrase core domain protein [Burkholderia pseudomallei MSHR1357]KGX00812.1 integrase core domain protein [Burkholderia pseudomallei MSHR640]